MAFWGIEVEPGEAHTLQADKARGRLHISQATLGLGSYSERCVVQCSVGSRSPVLLCSLLPKRVESCSLNIEFEEEDEVIFSVVGSRSVHLSGFYLGPDHGISQDGDGSDSYGEDVTGTEIESDYDTDEEEAYESAFTEDVMDDISDYDIQTFHSSPRPNNGVVIVEINDDLKSHTDDGAQKHIEKNQAHSHLEKQIVVKSSSPLLESEDEDGFPFFNECEEEDQLDDFGREETSNKKMEEASKMGKGETARSSILTNKRKGEGIKHDHEDGVSLIYDGLEAPRDCKESGGRIKKKKKRKAQKWKEEKINQPIVADHNDGVFDNNNNKAQEVDELLNGFQSLNGIDMKPASVDITAEAKSKKDRNQKGKICSSNVGSENEKNSQLARGENAVDSIKVQLVDVKPSKKRSYPNGLVVEKLSMGDPSGKRASPGSKVSVHYICKLKHSGKIFDSNISEKPFKFRLGIGQVIKGWDVGVQGMRVGDKRRLTIPPSMGYGPKRAGKIPANTWLVFDVELVDVQ